MLLPQRSGMYDKIRKIILQYFSNFTTRNSILGHHKMKRKLDANDVPNSEEGVNGQKEETGFARFGLDPRLLQGIAKQNFQNPTLVQSKAIPLALDGRDVLAKAKTGSGKTAAYLLPILHSVLKRKLVCSPELWEDEAANISRLLLPNAPLPSSSYLLENLLNRSTKTSKHSLLLRRKKSE